MRDVERDGWTDFPEATDMVAIDKDDPFSKSGHVKEGILNLIQMKNKLIESWLICLPFF